jgi:hypothetical protein
VVLALAVAAAVLLVAVAVLLVAVAVLLVAVAVAVLAGPGAWVEEPRGPAVELAPRAAPRLLAPVRP